HRKLDRSWLRVVEGSGHMVQHVAPGQVMAAIDQAAGIVWDRSLLLRPPTGLKAGGQGQAPIPFAFVPCATTAPIAWETPHPRCFSRSQRAIRGLSSRP